jgi:hypothetical protein
MKFKNIYLKILRRYVKESEKTIHVEAIVRDDLWEKLKNLIGKNFIWFITTPANYDYCKSYFNIRLTKEEFKRKLIERIEFLKEKKEEIQVHLHLCNVKNFFDKELQDEKFSEAMMFMSSVGLKPTKFAPGWNAYDSYTLKLARKYGIKFFYLYSKNPLDINRPKIKDGLIIKYFYKFWHDYDFA